MPLLSILLVKRAYKTAQAFIGFCIAVLLLSSCAGTSINETAYKHFLNTSITPEPTATRILIAPYNFGIPSKKYLQAYEEQIDEVVIDQLKKQGYNVAQDNVFETAWRKAVRKHGNIFTAGQASINQNAFKRVLGDVFASVREETDVDVILFTDLLEQLVVFSGNNTRYAKWHGVSRKPLLKGGSQLSAAFDWQQTVPAVSLRVIMYTSEGQLLFKSMGGLEVSRQLDSQRERFVRRDNLFRSQGNVEQGVKIALHPFIPFE